VMVGGRGCPGADNVRFDGVGVPVVCKASHATAQKRPRGTRRQPGSVLEVAADDETGEA
jgi:hypothetical protein